MRLMLSSSKVAGIGSLLAPPDGPDCVSLSLVSGADAGAGGAGGAADRFSWTAWFIGGEVD